MRKQHKRYSRPRKKYDKKRIDEENEIVVKYGLKNKKELWKASSYIERLRGQAKDLLIASEEEQKVFLNKLANLGLIEKKSRLDDVLALNSINLLERRLQTILPRKNLAKTVKEARQMIVHKRVIVNENIVNVPSYIVPKDIENKIKLKIKKPKAKEEVKEQKESQ